MYSEYIRNMTIHDTVLNLEEVDVSANIVTTEPIPEDEGIHADDNSVNVTETADTNPTDVRVCFNNTQLTRKMLMERMKHVRATQLAARRPTATFNAKQLIKSGRVNKNKNKTFAPQSPSDFMKMISKRQPDASFFSSWPQPHDIRGVVDTRSMLATNINQNTVYQPAIAKIDEAHVVAKTKDVNLAEIVTNALQDVLTSKITTVENVICKLRTEFEEKSVFTNALKRSVVMLNFEDDTARPVIQIDKQYMSIIDDWYTQCELLLDVEETHTSIPETIIDEDISHVLFQDINVKFKDDYLNNYLPLVINNIISQRSMKSFEKQHFKPRDEPAGECKTQYAGLPTIYNNSGGDFDVKKATAKNAVVSVLRELGVVVPANLFCLPTSDEARRRPKSPEWLGRETTELGFGRETTDLRIRVDPNILHKKTSTDVDIDVNDDGVKCYNVGYNALFPNFSDACAYITDGDSQDNATQEKDGKQTKICVLMNDKFFHTMTLLDPSGDAEHIITNHPEFGFVQLFGFGTNNPDVVQFIEKEFNHIQFNSIDEVNAKLQMTSQYIEFTNKHNIASKLASSEETQVKQYLQSTYTIDHDLTHKMKASTLHDIIVYSGVVKIDDDKMAGFRTRLSAYLKDIGLQKKRYNDGYYYYGIVEKEDKYMSNPLSHPMHTREVTPSYDLNKLVNERHSELTKCYELVNQLMPSQLENLLVKRKQDVASKRKQ